MWKMHRKGCMLMLSRREEPLSKGQKMMSKLCNNIGIRNPYYVITTKNNDNGHMLERPLSEIKFGFEMPDSHLKPEVLVKFLRGFADIIEEESKNVTD